jgi:hypothetical protein
MHRNPNSLAQAWAWENIDLSRPQGRWLRQHPFALPRGLLLGSCFQQARISYFIPLGQPRL